MTVQVKGSIVVNSQKMQITSVIMIIIRLQQFCDLK